MVATYLTPLDPEVEEPERVDVRYAARMRYETAWGLLQKLRRAMVRPERDRISGEVEVDETYIGGLEA